ncbi:MAG: ester cyclase, partial [Nocardioides sp.]
ERYHEELWVKRNTDALDDLIHQDFVDDTRTDFSKPGPDYARDFFAGLFTAFPGLKSEQGQLLADGDLAAIRWTLTGTMTGELWGMAPTGKSFRVVGIDIVEVRDDRIVRDWGGMADKLPEIFGQLGLVAGA